VCSAFVKLLCFFFIKRVVHYLILTPGKIPCLDKKSKYNNKRQLQCNLSLKIHRNRLSLESFKTPGKCLMSVFFERRCCRSYRIDIWQFVKILYLFFKVVIRTDSSFVRRNCMIMHFSRKNWRLVLDNCRKPKPIVVLPTPWKSFQIFLWIPSTSFSIWWFLCCFMWINVK